MAKTVNTRTKTFKKKVLKIVEGDTLKSIAVASILLNILFLVSIFVLTSSNTFDRRVYTAARNKYCTNVDAVRARAKELGDEKAAVKEWEVTCVSKEFQPYYQEAIDKFNASTKSQTEAH